MSPSVLDALHRIDPAGPHSGPAPSREDPALAAILGSPRSPAPAPGRGGPRRGVALVGIAAVLAVGGTVLAATVPWGGSTAFAGWTAEPVTLSEAETAARVAQCGNEYPTPDGSGPMLDPVVVDVRGPFTFAIFSDGSLSMSCYLQVDEETGDVRAGVASAGPVTQQVGMSGLTVEDAGASIWNMWPLASGAIVRAYGRVADDVTSVVLTLADGRLVAATVDNGWWGMWAPGEEGFPAVAEVTRADGSRSTIEIGTPEG